MNNLRMSIQNKKNFYYNKKMLLICINKELIIIIDKNNILFLEKISYSNISKALESWKKSYLIMRKKIQKL